MRFHILLASFESRFKSFQNIDWALVLDQRVLVANEIVRDISQDDRRKKSKLISFNSNTNRVLYKKSVYRYMWYLHGKIKHWQLTWFSCDITCARTFDQGHTGQGEVRNSRPHQHHHQHQQTIVVLFLIVHVGQLVCWSGLVDVELWKGWPQS